MNSYSGKTLKISGKTLSGLMEAVLAKNAGFRFQATGHSMSPFIKNGDTITVSPLPPRGLTTGDIVAAYVALSDSLLIHRIIKKDNRRYLLKGDNSNKKDGWFQQSGLIGLVTRVERNGRQVRYGRRRGTKQCIAFLSNTGLLNIPVRPMLRRTKAALSIEKKNKTKKHPGPKR